MAILANETEAAITIFKAALSGAQHAFDSIRVLRRSKPFTNSSPIAKSIVIEKRSIHRPAVLILVVWDS